MSDWDWDNRYPWLIRPSGQIVIGDGGMHHTDLDWQGNETAAGEIILKGKVVWLRLLDYDDGTDLETLYHEVANKWNHEHPNLTVNRFEDGTAEDNRIWAKVANVDLRRISHGEEFFDWHGKIWLFDNNNAHGYGAFEDGRLVGSVTFMPTAHLVHLTSFYVLPAYRHHRIEEKLFDLVTKEYPGMPIDIPYVPDSALLGIARKYNLRHQQDS